MTGCGFDDNTKAYAKSQLSVHGMQTSSISDKIATITASCEKEIFSQNKDQWLQTVEQAKKDLSVSASKIANAKKLLEVDDEKTRQQLYNDLNAASTSRANASTALNGIVAIVRSVEDMTDDAVKQAKGKLSKSASYNFSEFDRNISDAVNKYPDKKTFFEARKTEARKFQSEAKTALNAINGKDIVAKALAVQKASKIESTIFSYVLETQKLINQLDTSWTKTLTDMDIVDSGSRVRYQHKYLTVTNFNGAIDKKEEWVDISESVFSANEPNLGMSIQSKGLGKFDHEAEKTAQHPGYTYMAPPGQSNRYGQWQTDNSGNSFWVFYGQYALMRDLFWGPSYTPIYVNEYRDYNTSRGNGRTYYGKTSSGQTKYGSSGKQTVTSYAGSKYSTSKSMSNYKTFRSTNSGGSFSRSRYSNTGRAYQSKVAQSKSSGYRSSSGGYSRSSGGK